MYALSSFAKISVSSFSPWCQQWKCWWALNIVSRCGWVWVWVTFHRAVAAVASHMLQADTVCLTLSDSFVCHGCCPTFIGLGSDLTAFLQIPLRVSPSFLPNLPVQILADCSIFIWDKKYIAIEPSSNLIYSSVNTLVIVCNNLPVQTMVLYTH